MRIALLLLSLSLAFSAHAQESPEPPNLKAIRKAASDKTSALYYPSLKASYLAGDTTFTRQEGRYLFYGQPDDEHSPERGGPLNDSLKVVLRRQHLSKEDFRLMLRYTGLLLQRSPYSLRLLAYQRFAARETEDHVAYEIAVAKMNILLTAMLSTGDGKSAKTAFWVTDVGDEYGIIDALGFEYGGTQKLVPGPCDYLTLEKNRWGIEGLYFNVSISMAHLSPPRGK